MVHRILCPSFQSVRNLQWHLTEALRILKDFCCFEKCLLMGIMIVTELLNVKIMNNCFCHGVLQNAGNCMFFSPIHSTIPMPHPRLCSARRSYIKRNNMFGGKFNFFTNVLAHPCSHLSAKVYLSTYISNKCSIHPQYAIATFSKNMNIL